MLRRLVVATSLVASALPAAATGQALPPALLIHGEESVAYPDGPASLLFNPAAAGVRYPSELALSFLDARSGKDGYRGVMAFGGFHLSAAGTQDSHPILGLGLAAGPEISRLGFSSEWMPESGGGRVGDHRIGLLSRPVPWLSIGGVVEHVTAPKVEDVRLRRFYTAGVALRPLALSRANAHDAGTRLTLTADAEMLEGDRADNAEFRFGAEIEPLRGLAIRGLYRTEDHGFQLGLSLLGIRAGYHGQSGHDEDGNDLYATHTLSTHQGEDRTFIPTPREERVAVVRVSGDLGDESLTGMTFFGPVGTTPVAALHRQLEDALEDPLTHGVLLDVRGVSTMAQIEELKPRIHRLREAGKPVVAFMQEGGRRADFYLASACDRIVTSRDAFFPGLGLRSERRYYKQFLADWGVRLDRTSYGKYKSAYRNFSVDSTPPADREAIEHTLDVAQNEFVEAVTRERGIERARLMSVLDGRRWPAEDLQKVGLIDSIGYREDALRVLGQLAGLGSKPRAVRLDKDREAKREWTRPTRIAVIYAAGAIESGRSGNDLLMGPYMGAETMTRQIEAAFRNPQVEAVVLRVESPGGSSMGSDLIHHAVARAKRETGKPLIVSMGAYAASGGYHISVPADRIFANRFTATGSIGVLLVKPSFERWNAKHDVRQDEFQRGAYMRGWSLHRDWDPQIQASADSATYSEYREFVSVVAENRKLSFEAVDAAAQGRVWLGQDALDRKLIDQIGGLADAIAEARRRAGIPEGEKIRIAEYRRPHLALLQRLVGAAVSEAWQQNARMPAPGESLYWLSEDEAP